MASHGTGGSTTDISLGRCETTPKELGEEMAKPDKEKPAKLQRAEKEVARSKKVVAQLAASQEQETSTCASAKQLQRSWEEEMGKLDKEKLAKLQRAAMEVARSKKMVAQLATSQEQVWLSGLKYGLFRQKVS